MLAFPRYFDMFEMKRPQFINRYFEDEDESPFTNNQLPQQNKQPKRIQVPVQHEPTAQQYQRQFQQMPIPQPSGVSHSQQHRDTTAPVNNEMHRSAEMVRNLTEIPVQHVPLKKHGEYVSPPSYLQSNVDIEKMPKEMAVLDTPIENKVADECNSKTDVSESPQETESQNLAETSKRPVVRKQTSLIVSDDHTTPIPMPYDSLDDSIPEEIEDAKDKSPQPKMKTPTIRKQTSLIVSDDHTTPIPMSYVQPSCLESQIEEEQNECEGNQKLEMKQDSPLIDKSSNLMEDTDPNTCEKSEKVVISRSMSHDEEMAKHKERVAPAPRRVIPIKVANTSTAQASKVPLSSNQAREVPINVQQGTARPVQRQPRMQNHVTQPQHPSPEPTMSTPVQAGMPMPQPQPTAQAAQPSTSYTEQGDTYTQPKPPAPKPKEQWVDPRITAALESIQKIADEARTVGTQVDVIEVTSKDKKYLTLEEQLTKLLLKLDCIESFGDENVRSKRKACIKQVQQTLDALELKLIAS
uniref:flocculation protein FLO11-like isoform X2 n=1 Tax=Styela clava TaxID=7725 RepID=UPI00193A7BC4|nr:flocculation protein FLO11-like isoform X2 [Styela clava]